MEELSGFVTLIDPPSLKRAEFEAVLRLKDPGRATEWVGYPVIGMGVGFAFGTALTPRLKNKDGSDASDDPMWSGLLKEMTVLFERMVLSGPTDDAIEEMRGNGWDPEAGWKVAEQRAEQEREQAAILDGETETNWRRGRLRDLVSARELLLDLRETVQEALGGDFAASDGLFGSRDDARRMVRSMPSAEVAIELKTALHRNAQRSRAWQPNDVIDVDALSNSVPYCDIVVTEKHAHHALTTARLDQRMDCVILRRLADLPTALEQITSGG